MNLCPHCGASLPPGQPVCPRCGAPLPPPPAGPAYAQPPAFPGRPQGSPPQPPQPAAFYPRLPGPHLLPRKTFTWMDVCTVLGFVASIVGYFYTSIIHLPLGLASSIVGFRGDKTKGLAVAGIVISVIGLLIRLMVVLYENDLLPYWVTSGLW